MVRRWLTPSTQVGPLWLTAASRLRVGVDTYGNQVTPGGLLRGTRFDAVDIGEGPFGERRLTLSSPGGPLRGRWLTLANPRGTALA